MLKVENVTKCFGDLKAVDNLSFEVNDGEIFGLLGVNGAGKTTTFRMITGLLEADSGKITLDGKPIDYSVTNQIGFLPEERSLLTKLTVKDQAIFFGNLKGMNDKEILERLDLLLEKFGILEYRNKKIKELSKGNQQKIQFIMAILNHPKLLILDEPFSGLDPFNIELFEREIEALAHSGSMIIFSSHRMEHVELFCKKLVILVKGKSLISGYIKDIKKQYRRMNIRIKGNVAKEELLKIGGVVDVTDYDDELEVKIESEDIIPSVFDAIKNKEGITKFTVEEPSLNEIFISRVGESYEK